MTAQRYSLEDAGKLLGGLHPNTVRARAQKGKIPYEKDNTGKWWVMLDPEQVANDAPPKLPKPPTMEPPLDPTIVGNFKVLEATIETLCKELEAVRAERDALKLVADGAAKLDAEAAGLRVRLSMSDETLADVRARLDLATDENREMLRSILERMAVPAAPVIADTPKRPWWAFGRSKG